MPLQVHNVHLEVHGDVVPLRSDFDELQERHVYLREAIFFHKGGGMDHSLFSRHFFGQGHEPDLVDGDKAIIGWVASVPLAGASRG